MVGNLTGYELICSFFYFLAMTPITTVLLYNQFSWQMILLSAVIGAVTGVAAVWWVSKRKFKS
jgi:ABC-type antimicrobial peptide transport system permease subunit